MGYRAIFAGGGTGGHLYPALNLAEALRRLAKEDTQVMLVGAQRGIESRVLPEAGVPYRLLPLEPIYRSRPWRNWRLVPSVIKSGRSIARLFDEFAPNLVVGTGGYAAGPVVAWALYRGLPTAIQEQNSHPGLTTRWLAPYVDQLHLGYAEALERLGPGATTLVRSHGNPICWPTSRPELDSARRELGLDEGRVVLVQGGSQGSASLNAAVVEALDAVRRAALPPLPGDTQLLWATGPAHHSGIERKIAELGLGERVRPVPYIAAMEKALSLATLAVSRAGAMSLAELCAWGIPSLLVPLPSAAADHQRRNARALEAGGAAIVIEESELRDSPERLWTELLGLLNEPQRLAAMAEAAGERGNPRAADDIAADLWDLMDRR